MVVGRRRVTAGPSHPPSRRLGAGLPASPQPPARGTGLCACPGHAVSCVVLPVCPVSLGCWGLSLSSTGSLVCEVTMNAVYCYFVPSWFLWPCQCVTVRGGLCAGRYVDTTGAEGSSSCLWANVGLGDDFAAATTACTSIGAGTHLLTSSQVCWVSRVM